MSESRIRLTDQEWNTFCEVYLEEFEHAPRKQAFANACRRIRAEGGRVPAFRTFRRKLYSGKEESAAGEESSQAEPGPTSLPRRSSPAEPGPSSPNGPSKAKPGPSSDYQERLELIVRLYRTRSETAVDAVCDRLLPELEV